MNAQLVDRIVNSKVDGKQIAAEEEPAIADAPLAPSTPEVMNENPERAATAARGGWFACRVHKAGPAEDTTVYITLEDLDGAFPARWYSADPRVKKEMLATALTAIATSGIAEVSLTTTDAYGVISRFYVRR